MLGLKEAVSLQRLLFFTWEIGLSLGTIFPTIEKMVPNDPLPSRGIHPDSTYLMATTLGPLESPPNRSASTLYPEYKIPN